MELDSENFMITYMNYQEFCSSYLIERGFSAVVNISTKKNHNRGHLRLNLTRIATKYIKSEIKHL